MLLHGLTIQSTFFLTHGLIALDILCLSASIEISLSPRRMRPVRDLYTSQTYSPSFGRETTTVSRVITEWRPGRQKRNEPYCVPALIV